MFQSTRPRGARPQSTHQSTPRTCFNPRARAGRDQQMQQQQKLDAMFQSTRPRGARQRTTALLIEELAFQSTRPRGARLGGHTANTAAFAVSIHAPARGATSDIQSYAEYARFQSTRPRGARRCMIAPTGIPTPFQSTRPRGARPLIPPLRLLRSEVSIHAPARGATMCK